MTPNNTYTTSIEIDLIKHGLIKQEKMDEVMKHLYNLYGMVWPEACYDPYNEATQKFADRLLPDLKALNDILGFKK